MRLGATLAVACRAACSSLSRASSRVPRRVRCGDFTAKPKSAPITAKQINSRKTTGRSRLIPITIFAAPNMSRPDITTTGTA
jgi:hypothetical protein